jgi:serine/threonine protein kinase
MGNDLLGAGSVFAGDYRVVGPLSSGGMGAVYVVEQLSTGARRALKLMHPALVSSARLRERFEQEARVSARIPSDHVVAVLAAGVDDASGLPYLVMELLEGRDLASAALEKGSWSALEVREIFEQLCHGLGAAHALGIVHRDIKPENVFLANPRRAGANVTVKILDFGIAKISRDAYRTHTAAVGTPLWMAPEQARDSAEITPATDVWALGLLAFWLCCGVSYFRAASSPEPNMDHLFREILHDEIAPASARAAELGRPGILFRGFDAWFAHAVARNPAERFPDARAALAALLPVLDETRAALATTQLALDPPVAPLPSAVPHPTMPATLAVTTPGAPPALPAAPPPSRSSLWLAGAGVLIVAVLALGVGAALLAPRLLGASPGEAPSASATIRSPIAPSTARRAAAAGLDATQIQRVVASYTPSLRRTCYEAGGSGLGATERLRVKLVIAPSGRVTAASAEDPGALQTTLARCVTDRMKAWRFPAAERETEVVIPLLFTTGSGSTKHKGRDSD